MSQKLFTKNFILLVLGQSSSLFGNYILKFALSMSILELTDSATIFASILAIAMIPTILLSPFGGILADRANRRNIMIALDFISGAVVLVAAFFFSEQNSILTTTFILIALSILGAFESPTVQACVPQIHTGDNIIRANAVVNQIAAIASLISPILGSILYPLFGLKPIMFVSIVSFFLTALFECFISLNFTRRNDKENILHIIKYDFLISMQFIFKEQPDILKVLLWSTAASFFVIGTTTVGLPYTIRTILGLDAKYYGAAESILGLAAIAGSISISFWATKLKTRNLYLVLAALGIFLMPYGIIFLFSTSIIAQYAVVVTSVCAMEFLGCVFSIFALSIIQQKTPNELIGKIISYVVTITMCTQPLGQLVYGALFDNFSNDLYLVLIPTGIIACSIGIASKQTFKNLDN